MIKEIPMLYSTPMVQAIGLDRKTKTRRTKGLEGAEMVQQSIHNPLYFGISRNGIFEEITCPYGKPGDFIWARETFYAFGHWIEMEKKNGKIGVQFVDETILHSKNYHYIDNPPEIVSKQRVWGSCCWYKRPAIHMPKELTRHWLQITDIKVERLKDISEEDAIAEGVEPIADGYKNYATLPKIISTLHCWDTARMSFFSLWESINGVGSIELNPWVWVISFKRINHERQTD